MRESRAPRRNAVQCVGLALMLTAVLIVPPTEATSAWLIVDCSGRTAAPFTSINEAISSLTGPAPAVGQWDFIVLRSDCSENVRITGGRRLWIAPEWDPYPEAGSSTNESPARITAASANGAVLSVEGPQEVMLVNLVLSNGKNGLVANGNASIQTYSVFAENNADNGIDLDTGAALSMNEGGARGNGRYGIDLGLGASASLSGRLPWVRQQPLAISGNGAGGIRVDRGFVYGYTGVNVENNGGQGLAAYAGVAAFGDYQVDSQSVFQGNQGGAFVSEGSYVTFWSSVVLRNNGSYGVYVEDGGNASFIAFRSSVAGESRGVVIEGHTNVGVEVVAHSQAAFHGHHVIRANGSQSQGVSAGIWVDGSSHVYLDDGGPKFVDTPPEVVDNAGHGIVVTLNSSIDARAGIVHGNSGAGIVIHSRSVGYLGPDTRLLGPTTGGAPLVCDSTSLVSTNLVRRSNNCTNVTTAWPRPQRPRMPD